MSQGRDLYHHTALLATAEIGIELNPKQAAYIKKRDATREMLKTSSFPADRLTAAEQLIHYFDEEEECASYIMILHEDSKLVVVSKPWGSKRQQNNLNIANLEKEVLDEMMVTTVGGKTRL